MTKAKKSTSKDKFFIEGVDDIKPGNPVVSGEFVIPDAKEGELAQGQTVSVEADTKFSDDHGTGEAVIIRTYEFAANPETFTQYEKFHGHLPYAQEVFESHKVGIEAMLWGDGLMPDPSVETKLIFSKDKTRYLITVGARPMNGGSLPVNTQTLSEIFNGSNQPPKDPIQ